MGRSIARARSLSTYHKLYRLVANEDICVYCGIPADTVDHFVPISVVGMLGEVFGIVGRQFLVPACRECNSLAGGKCFKTIGGKRRYIQGRIRARNRSILAMPHWTENQISELGYNLAEKVRVSMVEKTWIEARLKWRNVNNKSAVNIAAIRSKFLVTGSGSAKPSAG